MKKITKESIKNDSQNIQAIDVFSKSVSSIYAKEDDKHETNVEAVEIHDFSEKEQEKENREKIIEAQMIKEEEQSVSKVAETATTAMESVSVEEEEFKQVEKKETETEVTETTTATENVKEEKEIEMLKKWVEEDLKQSKETTSEQQASCTKGRACRSKQNRRKCS